MSRLIYLFLFKVWMCIKFHNYSFVAQVTDQSKYEKSNENWNCKQLQIHNLNEAKTSIKYD